MDPRAIDDGDCRDKYGKGREYYQILSINRVYLVDMLYTSMSDTSMSVADIAALEVC
jgi:hypothetical protein